MYRLFKDACKNIMRCNYGPVTKSAIENYQDTNDLKVDGIAGPRTMYILNAENSPLFTNDELGGELEKLGLTFNDSSEENVEKFGYIFQKHPKVVNG